jgi:hypothetical protein
MDRDPIEMLPLDPRADTERWAALLQRVNSAAAPELARRAGIRAGGIVMLAQWSRPILAAAVVLALISVSVFRMTQRDHEVSGVATVAEALGFPAPVAEWLSDDRAPAEDDLLLALERRVR